jgi:hypothetical protein
MSDDVGKAAFVDASSAVASVRVRRYAPSDAAEWDAYVAASRNATFLLQRAYLDYHADRFTDHSLMIHDSANRLIAVLPADRQGELLRSHGGVTYGGFVIGERMTAGLMGEVFEGVREFLWAEGIRRVLYKTIPAIYHGSPSDEDLYWLFRVRANLVRRDLLSVIDYSDRLGMQERRVRALKKAGKRGLEVRDSGDFASFWSILDANLRTRYGVAPVHSLAEIELLAARFPAGIRLVGAFDSEAMVAGAVVYVSRRVCHVQYNAASAEGKTIGALDLVLDHVVREYADRVRYLDFGACTEQGGQYLNAGLVEYKEGFGGRTVVHDMYDWDLASSAVSTP